MREKIKPAICYFTMKDKIMPEDLTNSIADAAKAPKKVEGDAGSVEQHSLADQIAADRYLASKKALQSKGRGIRVTKMLPPGAG